MPRPPLPPMFGCGVPEGETMMGPQVPYPLQVVSAKLLWLMGVGRRLGNLR